MRVAVIGSSGFVGGWVVEEAKRQGLQVSCPAVRSLTEEALVEQFENVDAVVNCAGLALRGRRGEAALYDANVGLPERLLTASVQAKCSAFVHLSSVAALKSSTFRDELAGPNTVPEPDGSYGISKAQGERVLRAIATHDTALCIVRSPVIYGPKCAGILSKLAFFASKGIPLPLKALENRRHLIFVGNLARSLLYCAIERMQGTIIAADEPALTPGEMYDLMAAGAGWGPKSFSFPPWIIRMAARMLLGKRSSSLLDWSRYEVDHRPRVAGTVDHEKAFHQMMQAMRK